MSKAFAHVLIGTGRSPSSYLLRQFHGAEAIRTDLGAIALLRRERYIEEWPLARPAPLSAFARRVSNTSVHPAAVSWIAYGPAGDPLGRASLVPDQDGRAKLNLYVRPHARRQGLARLLFHATVRDQRTNDVVELTCATMSTVPAGELLARRLGASCVQVLRKAERPVDRAGLVRRDGVNQSGEIAAVTVQRDGELDEGAVRQLARLGELVRQRYHPTVSNEDLDRAVRGLSRFSRYLRQAGLTRWLACAFAENGALVGYSEYVWDAEEPDVLTHTAIAVEPAYRSGSAMQCLIDARAQILMATPSIRTVRHTRLCRHTAVACGRTTRAADAPTTATCEHFELRWTLAPGAIKTYLSEGSGSGE